MKDSINLFLDTININEPESTNKEKNKHTETSVTKGIITIDYETQADEWSLKYANILPFFSFKSELSFKVDIRDNFKSYFDLIFNQTVLNFFLVQINKRLNYKNKKNILGIKTEQIESPSKIGKIKYQLASIIELRTYIAVVLYMGICKLPEIRMYWGDKTNSFYNQSTVSENISYRRFTEINTHFSLVSMKKDYEKQRDI
ncbi:hypothetical protein CDIK_2560 [Cucumispora dikerogammari]|nr:hypothetical protein CDIK_2560 [Cucumispora dikerogammari]